MQTLTTWYIPEISLVCIPDMFLVVPGTDQIHTFYIPAKYQYVLQYIPGKTSHPQEQL